MSSQRYSVGSAIIEAKNGEKKRFLVLDDGIPSTIINKHLLIVQEHQARASSTSAYILCLFFNAMDELEIEITDVTLGNIYDYLCSVYVDEGKTYQTISSYIYAIAALYESLALCNYPLDKSLYRPVSDDSIGRPRIKRSRRDIAITKISMLRNEFMPRKTDDVQSTYTKWYTADEIEAVAAELSLVFRCIFYDTIFTGHRIDSTLSLTLYSVNLRNRTVCPTRSKTGKTHTSEIPPKLANMMQTYLTEERPKPVVSTGSTCPYFFLGKNGEPISYAAYYSALKRAGERASAKNPDLHIESLHTHAGRSTFAAALRSYQIEQKRQGKATFTDTDFCDLMDWKSLSCLENYDVATRAQEVSPLLKEFYSEYMDIASINRVYPVIIEDSLGEG